MSVNATAISGLNAATSQLELIGNNVANSNTFGFKSSFISLADSFSQGRSGQQSVNGVEIQSINQNFSQGGVTLTSRQLDISIQAEESFFVMSSAINGETSYTRAGRFLLYRNGFVTNANNERLQSFQISNNVVSATLSDLVIPTTPLAASPTTTANFGINLNATSNVIGAAFNNADPATYNFRTDKVGYDSLGISHTLETYYRKTADNNWDVIVEVDGNNVLTGQLTFNANGTFNTASANLSTVNYNPNNGASNMVMNFGFTAATQFGSPNETRQITQNGFSSGEVTSVDIDDDGIVSARFSNGELQSIAQIALAEFPSVNGLAQSGNMSFQETNASGTPIIESNNSTGAIQAGSLEETNVDLTQELVELVDTQRFFQANARVVTSSDEITQTILNI